MDEETRKKYLGILSEKDKDRITALAKEVGRKAEEFLEDVMTLSVTTKYQGDDKPVAMTNLRFDGDIDLILPKEGGKIAKETLDIHEKMVDLAMKNRRELISIFVELFDLKDIIKLT